MIDSDDVLDPVLECPDCNRRWHVSETADDGPGHEHCCPLCGTTLVPKPIPAQRWPVAGGGVLRLCTPHRPAVTLTPRPEDSQYD